ncbi:MAG: UvrD-helicase domain-containing protein [Pseudomonadota bacterium]
MPENLPKTLAEFPSKGYIIAPAGYGKTHLIALAVKAASHRQLILTHTFAGVNSIKTKMNLLGVPSSRYQVDTIASWTLRLCLAYPKTSGWKVDNPSGKQWNKLYKSCHGLLAKEFIRHVVSSTYSGFYVDEYQDCSELQHALVCSLAEFLPCRILGDPLQAIFDFADKPVDWETDIYPHFECLGQLEIPWRWHNAGAHEFASWLKEVRAALVAGQKINLGVPLPKSVKSIAVDLHDFSNPKRYTLFYKFLKDAATVIAIQSGDQQSKNKTHDLARALAGKFSSIEEVEGKDLFSFINKLQSAKTVNAGFLLALNFAKKCFTGVNKTLVAGTMRGESAKQTKATKHPLILDAANSYLADPTSKNLRIFFCLVRDNPETFTYRRDLVNRFLNVLRIHIDGGDSTLLESAHVYQREFRHSGRPIRHSKLIGTTLLVKGQEYDHAIILDADSLDMKELYVAMTRGAKSLTIITQNDSLPIA